VNIYYISVTIIYSKIEWDDATEQIELTHKRTYKMAADLIGPTSNYNFGNGAAKKMLQIGVNGALRTRIKFPGLTL
jgi:hypothetical protein